MSNENQTWYGLGEKNAQGQVEISIYDEIGFWGVSASEFIRDVKAASAGSTGVLLRINSPGGEVYDGLAIYNYLKGLDVPLTAMVDGIAASMASIVLMAADVIIVPENAFVMIHNPWAVRMGDADEMRKGADLLEKMGDSLASIYAERSGKDVADILALMNDDTYMTGAEAVELGFADFTSDAVQMAANMNLGKLTDIPAGLSQQIAEAREMSEIAEVKAELAMITTERDELSAKVIEATAAIEGHAEAVDAARNEAETVGADGMIARVGVVAEKYDAEFAVAHAAKTDAELATLWDEVKAQGADGVGSEGTTGLEGNVEFDYAARVAELKAEGKSAHEAHKAAKVEQSAIKPQTKKD